MLKRSRTEAQPGVWIDARRAVFLASTRTLVIADIHWGFAQSHRAVGNLLPLWGDEEIARILRELIDDYSPQEMIWLGDSVHTLNGRREAENFLQNLNSTTTTILTGNHDRRWNVPQSRSAQRENYFFHHGDDEAMSIPENAVEVIGHFHPAAGLYDGAGMRLRLPALVASSRRLILPAFSPWAAGVDWHHRLQSDEKLWALAPSRIFEVRASRVTTRSAS